MTFNHEGKMVIFPEIIFECEAEDEDHGGVVYFPCYLLEVQRVEDGMELVGEVGLVGGV